MDKRAYVGKPPPEFKFRYIKYEKRQGRATLTFNRPKALNALNRATMDEVVRALMQFQDDAELAQ